MDIQFEDISRYIVINSIKYEPVIPKVDLGALDVDFYCEDLGFTLTVKDYLKQLLSTLWIEEEGFSGKRPFGNSCWKYDIIYALIESGYLAGKVKRDEYGVIDSEFDGEDAEDFILCLIKSI